MNKYEKMKTQRFVSTKKRFGCSSEIFDEFRELGEHSVEHFYVLSLNQKNEMLSWKTVAIGSPVECHVSPREVFTEALLQKAVRIAVLHNHPSGDPSPSPHDIALTRRLAESGELVGVPVLDHLVITSCGYSSMRDMGILAQESN